MNIPDYVIWGAIALGVLILLVIIIKVISNSRKEKEVSASILDVDEVGVNESKDFTYGYEKEETVVMKPVEKEEKEEE